ncbi:DUF6685 family protein [Zestomonas thermotolerans]|uniref:DUF6685 family protein n=1 Tax=Zestomonas thermotolerans TaxID=157784 RepID=UPI0023F2FEC0|nr:DUF6685 family protein [Pseudomonas thermotolerans]
MTLPEPPVNLTSRLGDFARRLGLGNRGLRQLQERAAALRLPFPGPPLVQESIWWRGGPQLQRLVDLPRGALSGPVQDDKAEAHAHLVRVVEVERRELPNLEVRCIDGLAGEPGEPFEHLEDFAATAACRSLRLISYKDFLRTLGLALPHFLAGEPIQLLQAAWLGERLFWAGEHHQAAFASAIVYARLRGLQDSLPAQLLHYRLSARGVTELRKHYHVLTVPGQAWSDPGFMGLLLDNALPYARLPLQDESTPEILLLPRRHALANAFGEGLCRAGASDFAAYLQILLDAQPAD